MAPSKSPSATDEGSITSRKEDLPFMIIAYGPKLRPEWVHITMPDDHRSLPNTTDISLLGLMLCSRADERRRINHG